MAVWLNLLFCRHRKRREELWVKTAVDRGREESGRGKVGNKVISCERGRKGRGEEGREHGESIPGVGGRGVGSGPS